jgi:hypothetical protein
MDIVSFNAGRPRLAWFSQDGFTYASSKEQVTGQIEAFVNRMKERTKCLRNWEIRAEAAGSSTLSVTKSATDFRH